MVTQVRNGGFAQALLAGVEAARHELGFCTNPDVRVREGFLDPLVACFADPQVFAVAPRVLLRGDEARVESITELALRDGMVQIRQPGLVDGARSDVARLRPIAFAVGGTCMLRRAEFLEAARKNDTTAFDMHTIWGHGAQAALAANPSPGMWMHGDALARLERLGPGVLYAGLKACNDYAAGLESAARVRCPVLMVLGRRDVMTPLRAAQSLQEKLAGAKVVTVEGAGHALMAEAPDAVPPPGITAPGITPPGAGAAGSEMPSGRNGPGRSCCSSPARSIGGGWHAGASEGLPAAMWLSQNARNASTPPGDWTTAPKLAPRR